MIFQLTRVLIPLTVALAMSAAARAEDIYKHVDDHGRVTYSNKPIKGGKKVDLPELTTVDIPKTAPKAPPPAKADSDKDRRKADLKDEIAKEEKALDAAKQAYKEGEAKPEVWRRTKTVTGKDGKPSQVTESGRNVAAYEEKMKSLQAEVDLHEKRLQRLKADLADLDGATDGKK